MPIDAIVAGAGIWGCTVARRLAEAGRKVLVLEKRPVVGGNVRCEIDEETGIEIHKYGSHIFHTHIPEVWEFVNRFVKFNGYQHKVLANYKGKIYYLPLGLAMINKFFGVELKPGEVADFMADEAHASAIFDAFFRGYTSKQWGKPPEEIDPSIIKRVPVRSNYDVNYFNDYNQGIPLSGYNSLFERLLDHPSITVRTGVELRFEDGVFFAGGDGTAAASAASGTFRSSNGTGVAAELMRKSGNSGSVSGTAADGWTTLSAGATDGGFVSTGAAGGGRFTLPGARSPPSAATIISGDSRTS